MPHLRPPLAPQAVIEDVRPESPNLTLRPHGFLEMGSLEMGILPMGSLQKSMVMASLRAPHRGYYIVQEVCETAHPVDALPLRRAWDLVSSRHPALRSGIQFENGKPVYLRVHHQPEIEWREIDWTHLPTQDREERLAALLRDDRERGFDLEAGVPVRFALVRTSLRSAALIWTSHHALLDGRSYAAVWREWFEAYDRLVGGNEVPPCDPQPAGNPERTAPAGAESYWRRYFDGLSQTTDYIVDRIRCAAPPPVEPVGRRPVRFSPERTRQLNDFAARHEITLNTLVQGAWALLLSRYKGLPDVVFGVARSGRRPPVDDREVGFLLNMLPLRIAVPPDSRLLPWLRYIRSEWMALREWENTPLDQIGKWSALPPGMPPFESVVNFELEPHGQALRRAGTGTSRSFRRLQRTDSALTLAAYGSPVLAMELVYDSALFCDLTMSAVAGHLRTLLDSFLEQPGARLSELRMLTSEEQSLLEAEACTETPDLCAHELFERQAGRAPNNVALESGVESVSYGELNRKANRVAWYLRGTGIEPDDFVAIRMSPSVDAIAAILGVLKSGAAFLPLESSLPSERLDAVLADAQPRIVFESLDALRDELSRQPDGNPPRAAQPAHLAYAVYTSGSAGKPKGVAVSHRALVNHTLGAPPVYGISGNDRRLQFASVGSDVFVAEIFNYLSHGAALVLGWDRENVSIREFLSYLDERRITITGLPARWWSEWVAAIRQGNCLPPASLRAVIIGMEKADPAALLAWKKAVGESIRLFNAYGPTETSPTATIYEAGSSAWESESYVPIGKPIANTRACVHDVHGNPAPVGVAGELWIGGPGVARGYLNAPELTAKSFAVDRFGERTYRTGDFVFRLPDGNLVFVGRHDRQVKIRGFRVELDEIEDVLARHPAVRDCAVTVQGAEGDASLMAYFTSTTGSDPGAAQVRSYLSGRLPKHMLPAAVFHLQEMPRTASGKIDYSALPSCRPLRVAQGADCAAPATNTQKRLATLWTEILGLSPVGANDNFFELGADSLDAARFITMVETTFGKAITMASFWRAPTLAGMAELLDCDNLADAGQSNPLVCLQSGGSRLPFFCFPGADDNPFYFLELARRLGREQPFYVVRDPSPIEERGVYSVEEAASRFIPAMRALRPDGPYLVGGHCYGGIVAFEVARQLIAAGAEVGMLVLFEVPAPGYPKVLRHWKRYGRHALAIVRGSYRVTVGQTRTHLKVVAKLLRRRVEVLNRRVFIAAGLNQVVAKLDDPRLHPNTQAGRTYAPKALSCDVVQFIAGDEHHSNVILDDPRLAWREFTSGPFIVRKTPGKAAAIFKWPQARALASQLQELLDAPNRNGAGPDSRIGPAQP